MARQPYTPWVKRAVAVDKDEFRHDPQSAESMDEREHFAEGQQSGDVRVGHRILYDGLVEHLVRDCV